MPPDRTVFPIDESPPSSPISITTDSEAGDIHTKLMSSITDSDEWEANMPAALMGYEREPATQTSPVKTTVPLPIAFKGFDIGDAKEEFGFEDVTMEEKYEDEDPWLAQMFHIPAAMPQIEPDVFQPYQPRARGHVYRAQASSSFSASNTSRFQTHWLPSAGRRADIPIAGGMVYIRQKWVKIVVHTFTSATRTDLTPIVAGLFRLGGRIDGKNISSARLLKYVFRKLPGTVKITH